MARLITEDCIACGLCQPECPNDAIVLDGTIYVVCEERCTECVGFYDRPHCAEVCPVDGIQDDPNRRETSEELMAKAVQLHPERFPRD